MYTVHDRICMVLANPTCKRWCEYNLSILCPCHQHKTKYLTLCNYPVMVVYFVSHTYATLHLGRRQGPCQKCPPKFKDKQSIPPNTPFPPHTHQTHNTHIHAGMHTHTHTTTRSHRSRSEGITGVRKFCARHVRHQQGRRNPTHLLIWSHV